MAYGKVNKSMANKSVVKDTSKPKLGSAQTTSSVCVAQKIRQGIDATTANKQCARESEVKGEGTV